ncbi:hypothetical protein TNCV_4648201 [Trichonephila clavipes]|uniref:Uncharacterized protein n=1 Tax=Trichonephila clavipes TaxID=2585209 RepID=A0A8X6SXY2_TRICX|nr:hypothetical protein TNCV_4648201 [Trichonephila clavipes]
MNETTQQEKTTQLSSRNEQLNSAAGTKQLNSSVGTKQLNSALPSTAYSRLQPPTTACNRLHRLYSRIGFFYLLRTLSCVPVVSRRVLPNSFYFLGRKELPYGLTQFVAPLKTSDSLNLMSSSESKLKQGSESSSDSFAEKAIPTNQQFQQGLDLFHEPLFQGVCSVLSLKME